MPEPHPFSSQPEASPSHQGARFPGARYARFGETTESAERSPGPSPSGAGDGGAPGANGPGVRSREQSEGTWKPELGLEGLRVCSEVLPHGGCPRSNIVQSRSLSTNLSLCLETSTPTPGAVTPSSECQSLPLTEASWAVELSPSWLTCPGLQTSSPSLC